jgi:hypothetical protein
MSQQSPDPSAKSQLPNDPPDCATEAPGDMMTMTEFLFSELPPHPPGEPVTPLPLTPIPLSEWPEYAKRCRDEIYGARPKGWLWCGIPQD